MKATIIASLIILGIFEFMSVLLISINPDKNFSFKPDLINGWKIFYNAFELPVNVFGIYVLIFSILSGIYQISDSKKVKKESKKEISDFDKYLYPRRIEIFTEFLNKLEKCKKNINGIIFTIQVDKHNKRNYDFSKIPYLIKEIFEPLNELKHPVKVILSDKYREQFDKTLDDLAYQTIYNSIIKFDKNEFKKIETRIKSIETILIDEIDSMKN